MSDVKRETIVMNGITFDVTTTTIHNPEAVKAAQEYLVREAAKAIIARWRENGGDLLASAVLEPEVPALDR